MKKRIFGIVLIVVIVALAYSYIKGKGTTNAVATDPTIGPDDRLKLDSSEEMLKIRLAANDAYRDLKGWGALHPEPYRPIVKFTQPQFAKFVEFYRNVYPKGFQRHIDKQGAAWNRTSELYQLKLALNRLLATV